MWKKCRHDVYHKSRGLRASGFKGIDLNLLDMKPGGIKFESDAVVFKKRAELFVFYLLGPSRQN